MADFKTIASAVTSGLSAIGGIAQPFISASENRKNREWQESMYNRQRVDSLADWERDAAFQKELIASEREYNSMSNQVKRAVEAGINPNSIAGSVTGNAGVSSVDAPGSRGAVASGLSSYSPLSVVPFQNGLNALQAGILQASQIDISRQDMETRKQVAEADVKLKMAQAITEASKARNIDTDTLAQNIRNMFLKDREQAELQGIQNENELTMKRIDNMVAQTNSLSEDYLTKKYNRLELMPRQAKMLDQNYRNAVADFQNIIQRAALLREQTDYVGYQSEGQRLKNIGQYYENIGKGFYNSPEFLSLQKDAQEAVNRLKKAEADIKEYDADWYNYANLSNTTEEWLMPLGRILSNIIDLPQLFKGL